MTALNGEALAKAEAALAAYNGKDRVVTSTEFWRIQNSKPSIDRSFSSGISTLDQKCEKFEPGEVWVVSGPTGHGKTLLCDTMTRNFIRGNAQSVWFTFEVGAKKLLAKYKTAQDPIVHVPLELNAYSLDWIEKRVHEAKLKYDCRVVFIDHLHYVVNFERLMKARDIEIGATMRALKQQIAVKHNVCVFLIAHMTKLEFKDEPNINDIRDSSFIGQEADGVLIVYRVPEKGKKKSDQEAYANKARLVIDKARRSGVMKWRINMLKIDGDLREMEPEATNDAIEPTEDEMATAANKEVAHERTRNDLWGD